MMSREPVAALFAITGAERQGLRPSSASDATREPWPAEPARLRPDHEQQPPTAQPGPKRRAPPVLLTSCRTPTKAHLVHHGGTRFQSEPCGSLVSLLNRQGVARGDAE